ncbi:MAG TPA: methyltransferase [Myxococcales bacterium]|nr:methyltransferase [Myxococcales bacterium]
MTEAFSDLPRGSREYFQAAAVAAGHELGLFEALPGPAAALAERLHVGPRRLYALVRALLLQGALVESDGMLLAGSVPLRRSLPSGGWGQLGRVIREDRPLFSAGIDGAAGEELRRFHDHLRGAGAGAAREVAELLGPRGPLLDLGGGAGAYAAAFLEQHPGERAIVVDRPAVLELARAAAPSAELVALDLAGPSPWPRGARVALLANVLHLFPAAEAARLVQRAARSVDRGGTVAVKDLDAASEAGILFSLNMAVYTESGEVHDTDTLLGFLRDAGLRELRAQPLRSAPDAVLVRGTVR